MNARADFCSFETNYDQLETRFDPEFAVAWTYMKPGGPACFNVGLLNDLRAHDQAFEANRGCVPHRGEMRQAHYHVLASKIQGIYNLGGDLMLFVEFIRARDREALLRYAKLCIDDISARINNYNAPVTTVSLVQGDALGGGFETALSSNVIVAERSARMGLPEILFNLFPGMGAYSLLGRRLGARRSEEMILSGRLYSAAELAELGLVDVLAEDGCGEHALYEFIRRNQKRRNGMQAVFRARQQFGRISYEELINITNIWVDAALRLEERDLKVMTRFARAQLRRLEAGTSAEAQLVA
jgi:DSF synthase